MLILTQRPHYTAMLCLLLLFMPSCSKGLGGTENPRLQVDNLLSKQGIFTDGDYQDFTWKTFFNSGLADATIDIYNPDYSLLNAAVFYQTNKFRENHARKPLEFSPELRDAALYHSLQMAEKNFYNHLNPKNKAMKTWVLRAQYFGFPSGLVGENIHRITLLDYDYKAYYPRQKEGVWHYYKSSDYKEEYLPLTYRGFAENVVKEWANSKGHRANMLHQDYTHLGCGIVPNSDDFSENNVPDALATQDFGSR